jgi:MYXO-CTERM domain-containing protein
MLLALSLFCVPARADEVHLAVIGDYGDDDDNSRAVADMILGWQPDHIVTVGDNDYTDGKYRGTFTGLELGVGQYFSDYIGDYKGEYGSGSAENRFWPAPGDHDWGDTCDDPRGLDDYLAYFTLPGKERYYDVRLGPVHLFSLDSMECEPDGADMDSVQAAWLRDAAAASDAPFKIVASHHPPYSSGHHGTSDGEHMQWPWAEWGIDLVLSGHDHDYERIYRDDVTIVVNGLGGLDRRDFECRVEGSQVQFNEAHGAMRIHATDGTLTVRFLTVDGDEIDAFTLDAAGGMPSNTDPSLGEAGVDECPGGGIGCSSTGSTGAVFWLAGLGALFLRRRSPGPA